MATWWASETDEKVNYTKLCRLLIDGGTLAVRTVFDGIHPPASLSTTLTTNRSKLQKLKGKVLNQGPWDKLYPPSAASIKSENFDITLLFVLLRNICGLTPPATGWDALPSSTDTSLEANLARIKYYRNNVIAHSSKAEVDDTLFKTYWNDISGALVSLGLKQDAIDDLKSSPLGTQDYNQLGNDWYLSDQEIKCQLEAIKSDTSAIKSDTSAIKSGIDEIRDIIVSKQAIDRLPHRDFSSRIDKLCDIYHPNTREWLLTDVTSSVDQRNVVVIEAGPGMGKSVVAAKLCQQYKHQGNLGGCHFFGHDNSLHNNPRSMLQSVARQLSDAYPEYRDVLKTSLSKPLGKDMSELSCVELFTLLFEEPCSKINPNIHYVIIIDALDECCNSLKKELFRVLLDKISVLPSWLRFVLTTRPPPSMSSFHSISKTINIDPKDPRNNSDILTYFTDKLEDLEHTSSEHNRNQITQLVDVTEGLFLVAFFVIDFLRKTNVNSISEAVEQFPKGKGITSVYEDYFSRLQDAITPHIRCEEGFFEMLDAIVAAKFPIEKIMLYSILGLKDEPRVPNRERKEAVNLLHQLFPVENDHVSAFHKTVIDWLTAGDHDYKVKGDGCGVLANKCYDVINSIKQNIHLQHESPDLTDSDKYALSFGSEYYEESFSEEKKIEMQTDPEVLCLEAFFAVQDYYNRDELRSIGYRYENLLEQHLSDDCRAIYDDLKRLFTLEKTHSTSWHKPPTYVQLLEFAYRAANLLSIGDTAKTLDYLKEKGIAYLERQTLLELNDKELVQQILACNNGFLLVLHKNIKTLVRRYQLNGNLVKEVSFDGHKKLYMSPDDRFIVAIPSLDERDIDIIDAATLQIHNSYESPNVVRSCHVFGSQPWYLVVRCFNNKIYVMDGETGKLVGDPTAVQQNDDVHDVSKVGHILMARTSDSCVLKYQFSDRRFTDENGYFCTSMVWEKVNRGRDVLPPFNQGASRASTSPSHDNYVYRELFLSDYKSIDDKMPIYARLHRWCQCRRYYENTDSLENNEQPLCFSEDGDLLAFYYCQCITVVHTSDGSLYKSVCLPFYQGCAKKILLLSKERIIIHDKRTNNIFCLKFGGKKYEVLLEHIFFLPKDVDISCVLTTKENNLMALIVEQFTAKTKWVNHLPRTVKVSTHSIQKYNYF